MESYQLYAGYLDMNGICWIHKDTQSVENGGNDG